MTDSNESCDHIEKSNSSHRVEAHYNNSLDLPSVLSSGVGAMAEKLTAITNAAGTPITEADLKALLSKAMPDASINTENFRLVSEIISFLCLTDKEWNQNKTS